MGCHRIRYSNTVCLVYNAQMAGEFCLQNRIELVDIFIVRIISPYNSIINCNLAELAGGYEEPGGGASI